MGDGGWNQDAAKQPRATSAPCRSEAAAMQRSPPPPPRSCCQCHWWRMDHLISEKRDQSVRPCCAKRLEPDSDFGFELWPINDVKQTAAISPLVAEVWQEPSEPLRGGADSEQAQTLPVSLGEVGTERCRRDKEKNCVYVCDWGGGRCSQLLT